MLCFLQPQPGKTAAPTAGAARRAGGLQQVRCGVCSSVRRLPCLYPRPAARGVGGGSRAVQALRCVVQRHRPNGKCSRTVAFLLLGGEKLDFLSLGSPCEEKLKEFCQKKGERASEAEKAGKQP